MNQGAPKSKVEFLNEIRAEWQKLSTEVKKRFGDTVNMPEKIYYVNNTSFLARVWSSPSRVGKLEINEKALLPENYKYFCETIVPHEFAHAWNAARNNRDSHGPNWQTCMRLLGVYPSRCGSWPSDKNQNKNSGNLSPVCNSRNLIDLGDY